MNERTIRVTKNDARRLRELVETPGVLEHCDPECLENLKKELDRAEIVEPEEISSRVVTMNSTVRLVDIKTGEPETYTLVLPQEADIDEGRISVLAPIGTAMLGYKVGDTFAWPVPGGVRRLRVNEVTRPVETTDEG